MCTEKYDLEVADQPSYIVLEEWERRIEEKIKNSLKYYESEEAIVEKDRREGR